MQISSPPRLGNLDDILKSSNLAPSILPLSRVPTFDKQSAPNEWGPRAHQPSHCLGEVTHRFTALTLNAGNSAAKTQRLDSVTWFPNPTDSLSDHSLRASAR